MKKYILFILLAVTALGLSAQTNPRKWTVKGSVSSVAVGNLAGELEYQFSDRWSATVGMGVQRAVESLRIPSFRLEWNSIGEGISLGAMRKLTSPSSQYGIGFKPMSTLFRQRSSSRLDTAYVSTLNATFVDLSANLNAFVIIDNRMVIEGFIGFGRRQRSWKLTSNDPDFIPQKELFAYFIMPFGLNVGVKF